MLPVRLINTADCYNLVLHLRFVSGSLTEINWSVAASCGLMLSVTSDLFGGFYWSCALFTALLGFICPGENRGENAHLLHLNTQCSTQHTGSLMRGSHIRIMWRIHHRSQILALRALYIWIHGFFCQGIVEVQSSIIWAYCEKSSGVWNI